LRIGIRSVEFWDLSHGEIQAEIRAFNRREKERAKEERIRFEWLAIFLYRTSIAISAMVWEPKKAPTIKKLFPELFQEEESSEVPQWKRQQAGMAAYAAAHNARLRAKKKG